MLETTVTLRLVNDTRRTVTVRSCGGGASCSAGFSGRKLHAGDRLEATVDANRLVQVYKVEQPGTDACLPIRVHDAYQRFGGDAFTARLSQATPCPGTTVLPHRAGPKPATL